MFPLNPVKDEIYIVANKEWLFNGYGFVLVPDSSITEESDPIWNSEKHEYAKKAELQDYVPIDILDSTLVDYVKQEEISDIIPQFQKTITQDQFVWYNDYLVIDIEEISHSKKVTILSLYIYTSKGIIKGTSIVSYPTTKRNSNALNFTYFYLKDTLGIISKANDIEKISISYNISNQDREVDIQGTLGRNILFEEVAGQQAHGKFVMDSFHGVYPENTHQKILSIDLPEVTGEVHQEFQPYICSKYECNLVSKPYVGAATSENYLSNPEILTIGSHYNNDNIRRDITSAPDKFLSNTVAVSAGQNKDDTTSLWTSYGYGVEFFESFAKEEIDQRYPDKLFDHAIARIITTPDNQGLIYKTDGAGWSAIVEVGQKVRIRYSASNDVEVTVTSIVSDDEIRINQTVAPILETDSNKYLYTYVTVGAIGYYRPQQSPTCGMVAAKFRKIQDKTNANWQVCREAARATASNSTFILEGTDKIWTTNWDMHRGFGIIDVDSAVEYIHQHYIDNVDYKKSAAYTLPKSNPFLGIDDIERDTFVSKANLEEYVERFSGNASLPQNILEALDNSLNPSGVNPFATEDGLNSKLNSIEKGTNNGVAELDAAGKVPASQLPSYVDDVLEFATLSAFPAVGESGKIYTAIDTNIIYRWGGTGYVEISSTIALGETNNTAYRGDRGKIAYDHSQAAHAPTNAQKNSDITKGEIEAKLTGNITSHSHNDLKTWVTDEATAYDSARLGGHLANLYPRRNVAETISNTWNFSRINTSGYLYMTANNPRIEFHDTTASQACRWILSGGSMRLQTVEYGTSVYTGQSVNFSTLAPNNSMNLHSSGELSLLGNITAEKGTLSSLDVSGIINMGGDKVATESWVTNNFAPITPSDIRLKDNIIPIENSLDDILKLNPVHFTYKNDKTKTKKSGFIAQELREVYPQFVGGQETDTEYLNIDPANMVSVLTKGMQELIEEVRSLREELNIIKEQNMV